MLAFTSSVTSVNFENDHTDVYGVAFETRPEKKYLVAKWGAFSDSL